MAASQGAQHAGPRSGKGSTTEDLEVLVGATPELQDDVMTIAEQFRQQGIERGMPLGQRTVLVRQLERKFGALPHAARAHLDGADETELGKIADRFCSPIRTRASAM